jgi:hypothetical protein
MEHEQHNNGKTSKLAKLNEWRESIMARAA